MGWLRRANSPRRPVSGKARVRAVASAVWLASAPPEVKVPSVLAGSKPKRPAKARTRCCSTSAASGLWLHAASWGLKVATRASAAMPMGVVAGLNSPK